MRELIYKIILWRIFHLNPDVIVSELHSLLVSLENEGIDVELIRETDKNHNEILVLCCYKDYIKEDYKDPENKKVSGVI